MVHAFGEGIMTGPFSDSLIKNPVRTFGEIRRRVVAHITVEEAVPMKRGARTQGKLSPKKVVKLNL